MQRFLLGSTQAFAFAEPGIRFAQKASRSHRAVINGLADPGLHHFNDSPDKRARCVVFPAVTSGVAHALDFVLIQSGKLKAFLLGAKAQPIHEIQHIAQYIAALDFVFDLAEDFADFVLYGIR